MILFFSNQSEPDPSITSESLNNLTDTGQVNIVKPYLAAFTDELIKANRTWDYRTLSRKITGITSVYNNVVGDQSVAVETHRALLSVQFNSLPNKPSFLRVCSTSLLKILWEKEKLLVTSNFSFSDSFLSFWRTLRHSPQT